MSQYHWKIGGEAGFGIMTTGLAFSRICSRLGYDIIDYVEYPSLVRGGHNTYSTIWSDASATSLKKKIDTLVCLNSNTYLLDKENLHENSLILVDTGDATVNHSGLLKIPFEDILKKLGGQTVMKNTVALGATLALLGAPLEAALQLIGEEFGRKGEDIVKKNQEFAREGYDYVTANHKEKINNWLKPRTNEAKMVINGNEAFSLASAVAGCKFYCAYPMTPASTVLSLLAGWQKQTGMVVRHAEDEIAVINSALGASFMGARSAVGTSGGGFALMAEAVSLAGITETPIVIFIAQRPGPATGMPTWTEQGDLLFAVNSGHGEFPKIVLAPGDQEEMLQLTFKAFDLADIYQTPVFVLSDMFLAESHRTIPRVQTELLLKSYTPDRGQTIVDAQAGYLRYRITDDGISPRLVPGTTANVYQANSYEHLEDGHTTEDAAERIKQSDKRSRKQKTYLAKHFSLPKIYGDMIKAETVFVGWGSVKGPVMAAMALAAEKGMAAAFVHFNHVYPLDEKRVAEMLPADKKMVLVENNQEGQFGKLLRQETGVNITNKILRYDGRPLTGEYIFEKLIVNNE